MLVYQRVDSKKMTLQKLDLNRLEWGNLWFLASIFQISGVKQGQNPIGTTNNSSAFKNQKLYRALWEMGIG